MGSILDIHNGAVAGYIGPGGQVTDEIVGIARKTVTLATHLAPSRTGNLARATKYGGVKKTGIYSGRAMVYNNARHVLWVHEGTSRIYARGDYLLVPRGRGLANSTTRNGGAGTQLYKEWAGRKKAGPRMFARKDSVAGQTAQPFLAEALAVAMGHFRVS